MEKETILKKLNNLYSEGLEVKATVNKRENSKIIDLTHYTVDNGKFVKWQSKCIVYLENILKPTDFRLNNFKENVKHNYEYSVIEGLGILKSLIEDIEEDIIDLNEDNLSNNPIINLESILNNFHRVVRQLRIRHKNRKTIEIKDEYDVQDLLHGLLLIHFDDVRDEEWTPSYAGGSSRMDFLLKDENIVIETKMTRETLKDKRIGDELLEDIGRYSQHPNCKTLYCFIYDPNEFIKNPNGLEKDLSDNKNGLKVKVIIAPKY